MQIHVAPVLCVQRGRDVGCPGGQLDVDRPITPLTVGVGKYHERARRLLEQPAQIHAQTLPTGHDLTVSEPRAPPPQTEDDRVLCATS